MSIEEVLNIRWEEATIKTSALHCERCGQEIGKGKIAIAWVRTKDSKVRSARLCKTCGEKKEKRGEP